MITIASKLWVIRKPNKEKNMNKSQISIKLTFTLYFLCALSIARSQPSDYKEEAEKILDSTGIKGGLIIHIGCGDGKLTAAFGANNSYIVQGLDTDVTGARQTIRSFGLYGKVSAEPGMMMSG